MAYSFLPEALPANAAGQLSDAQRAMFEEGPFRMKALPELTGDLHHGEVRSIDGPILKRNPIYPGGAIESSPGSRLFFVDVAGERFQISSYRVWEEIPGIGYVRLYYLPRSKVAVNLEKLPDPPVDASPQQFVESSGSILGALLRPKFSKRGRAKKAETLAHANAVIQKAVGSNSAAAVQLESQVSPAPDTSELVGRWTSVFFNVDVGPDGTLSIESAQGGTQPGRWHLDDAGQLHVLFAGSDPSEELVTKVSLTGDQLAIDFGGQAITLQRGG